MVESNSKHTAPWPLWPAQMVPLGAGGRERTPHSQASGGGTRWCWARGTGGTQEGHSPALTFQERADVTLMGTEVVRFQGKRQTGCLTGLSRAGALQAETEEVSGGAAGSMAARRREMLQRCEGHRNQNSG